MNWIRVGLVCFAMGDMLAHGAELKGENSDEITSITVSIDKAFTQDRDSEKKSTLSREEVAGMPHVQVRSGKSKDDEKTYSGVALATILDRAGIRWEQGCGTLARGYLIVRGDDGYQALFAIAEIDPKHREHMVILADGVDGHKLPEHEAPWKSVEDRNGFCGRSVRLVTSLSVKLLPEAP